MGHQALSVSGLVLFILMLAAHFGSKSADRRDRRRLALVLAALSVLVAAAIVAWEVVMYAGDGLAIRRFLIAAWALIALVLGGRALGLVADIRDRAARETSGRRRGRY